MSHGKNQLSIERIQDMPEIPKILVKRRFPSWTRNMTRFCLILDAWMVWFPGGDVHIPIMPRDQVPRSILFTRFTRNKDRDHLFLFS